MNQLGTRSPLNHKTAQRQPKRPPRSRMNRAPHDPAIHRWLAAFHQLHIEDDMYAPVTLRFASELGVDCSATQLATDRHVYEVALRRDARGEKWVLIDWEVDVPGILFCDCADRDEAMTLFADPSQAAERWHGVRLRPESRPW